jgi:hypothetical protein
MSELDEVLKAAESLDPDDRIRLIARLWQSLPNDHWAAPGGGDRRGVRTMLDRDDLVGMAGVPRRVAWRIIGSGPREKIYSAPRRFDLYTIFVVTFAYSLLFAIMSGLQFEPMYSLIIGGFITIVGVGQAILFGGQNGRIASVITGAVATVPITFGIVMATTRGFRGDEMILTLPVTTVLGACFGYLAGVLVGGVFLIADKLRQFFAGRSAAATGDAVDTTERDAE